MKSHESNNAVDRSNAIIQPAFSYRRFSSVAFPRSFVTSLNMQQGPVFQMI